jgi:ligand-binding sensor domain-containing protein
MLRKPFSLSILTLAIAASALGGNWTSYTNSDNVRKIIFKGDRIWGATSGGVISYRPSTGDMTKLTNTDGLGSIDVRCVEEDTSGNLWFGTSDGWLSRISQSGQIRNFAIKDSLGFVARAVALNDLKIDGDRLWIASDLGVSKFLISHNGGEIKDTARRLGNLPDEVDINCVQIIGNYLWAGTGQGIAFIDKDNPNIQYYGFWRSFGRGEDSLGSADIRTIVSYYDTVVVGTANGVYRLMVSPDTAWSFMGLGILAINKLIVYDGILLAATNDGLLQFSGGGWIFFPFSGLPRAVASDLAIDSSSNLWAGTPGSGLGGLIDTLWVLHSIPGPASNFVRKIALDSVGGTWMTHDGRGVSRLLNGQWTVFNSSNSDPDGPGPLLGLQDNDAWSITAAPDNNIWVGSFGGGLYEYNRNSWVHWDTTNSPMFGVPENQAYWAATAITADKAGNIWVSSLSADSGLVMGAFSGDQSPEQWSLYHAGPDGAGSIYAYSLLAREDTIWVGRGDGLDKLDFHGTPFNQSDDSWESNISREYVFDMTIDPFGTLWFGSPPGAYYLGPDLDTIRVRVPPEIAGSVNTIASDGVGNIWIGTVAGVGVLRPDRLTWDTTFTTANSPLLNNKVNDITIEIRTGRVFIGTEGGLSIYESGILPPSPDLSDVEAYPNPVNVEKGASSLRFKRAPADATITIYTISGDMVIQFRLSDPGRESWDLKNSKGEAVAAGVYFFHVKSGKASGTGKFAIIR